MGEALRYHELFIYSNETGDLIWSKRPRQHFNSDHGWKVFNSTFAGKIAGNRACNKDGSHKCIDVRICGKLHKAHRLVWEMNFGTIPEGKNPEHRDVDAWNNKLTNLRLATHAENKRNIRRRKDNRTGSKGVGVCRGSKKFRARIRINGREVNLGRFETSHDASVAYAKAAPVHHGEFARTE